MAIQRELIWATEQCTRLKKELIPVKCSKESTLSRLLFVVCDCVAIFTLSDAADQPKAKLTKATVKEKKQHLLE